MLPNLATRSRGQDKGPSDCSVSCWESPWRRKESGGAAAQQGLGLGERASGCCSSADLLCEATSVSPHPVATPALASVSSYRTR